MIILSKIFKLRNIKLSFIYLLPILVLFVACKKDNDSSNGPQIISGKVLDANSGIGISKATVELYENSNSAFGVISAKKINTLITDNYGSYTLNFNARSGYSYYLNAYNARYYGQTDLKSFTPPVAPFLSLLPVAYVRLKLINTPPKHVADTLVILGVGDAEFYFRNFSKDTVIKKYKGEAMAISGSKYYTIAWNYHDQANIEPFIIKFNPIPFDTVTVNINY